MYIKKLSDKGQLDIWVDGMNNAFEMRSSKNVPYVEIKKDDFFLNDNEVVLALYNSKNEIIGGACISYEIGHENIKIAKIYHVWVATQKQHEGIGAMVMNKVEKVALSNGAKLLQLNVANVYLPAVSLYKKVGFKRYKIYANVPKTYYFIRMIKPIGGYVFSERKRIYMLIKSWIIFRILFDKDSSPTIINKLYYKYKLPN